jgi:hypothetical protein
MDGPGPSTLRKYGKGGHSFLALQGYTLFAGTRDPTVYEYGARPANDKAVSIAIHSGSITVSGAAR